MKRSKLFKEISSIFDMFQKKPAKDEAKSEQTETKNGKSSTLPPIDAMKEKVSQGVSTVDRVLNVIKKYVLEENTPGKKSIMNP